MKRAGWVMGAHGCTKYAKKSGRRRGAASVGKQTKSPTAPLLRGLDIGSRGYHFPRWNVIHDGGRPPVSVYRRVDEVSIPEARHAFVTAVTEVVSLMEELPVAICLAI